MPIAVANSSNSFTAETENSTPATSDAVIILLYVPSFAVIFSPFAVTFNTLSAATSAVNSIKSPIRYVPSAIFEVTLSLTVAVTGTSLLAIVLKAFAVSVTVV